MTIISILSKAFFYPTSIIHPDRSATSLYLIIIIMMIIKIIKTPNYSLNHSRFKGWHLLAFAMVKSPTSGYMPKNGEYKRSTYMEIIQRLELQVVSCTISIARLILPAIIPVWWPIDKILPEYSNGDFSPFFSLFVQSSRYNERKRIFLTPPDMWRGDDLCK